MQAEEKKNKEDTSTKKTEVPFHKAAEFGLAKGPTDELHIQIGRVCVGVIVGRKYTSRHAKEVDEVVF